MSMKAFIVLFAVGAPVWAACGQLTPVTSTAVFEHSEPLNLDVENGSSVAEFDLFNGLAQLQTPSSESGSSTGFIKFVTSSSLDGDLVTPHTPPYQICFLFASGETRPGTFVFAEDVYRFGGYFENNSPEDDAVIEFFDRNGALIYSELVSIPKDGQTWVGHGWRSTVAIRSLTIKGMSEAPFSGGFIWFDDLSMTTLDNCTANTDVDIVDFLNVLDRWGVECSGPCGTDANADFRIGIEDFLAVPSQWGECS